MSVYDNTPGSPGSIHVIHVINVINDIAILQEDCLERSERWFPATHEWPPEQLLGFLALGLAGEAGEVANKVKKVLRSGVGASNLQIEDIVDEVADTVIYALLICETLGYDLATAIAWNQGKNERRFGGAH